MSIAGSEAITILRWDGTLTSALKRPDLMLKSPGLEYVVQAGLLWSFGDVEQACSDEL